MMINNTFAYMCHYELINDYKRAPGLYVSLKIQNNITMLKDDAITSLSRQNWD